MRLPFGLRHAAAATLILASCSAPAAASEQEQILDAIKWANVALGASCDLALLASKEGVSGSRYFEIRYRDKGQDQDSPDNSYPLYQLLCGASAYETRFVFLTRAGEHFQLLAFAEPRLDYDYTDETFTRLKAPSKVIGFTTTNVLVNGAFDPKTATISMQVRWQGLAGAWSSGRWTFAEGQFALSSYDVDPTRKPTAHLPLAGDDRQDYQVYPQIMGHNNK